MDTATDSTTEKVKVHRIIAGPFSSYDHDDTFQEDDEFFFVDALVEYDGVVQDMTICNSDFDSIYAMVKHLKGPTIEPYILGDDN